MSDDVGESVTPGMGARQVKIVQMVNLGGFVAALAKAKALTQSSRREELSFAKVAGWVPARRALATDPLILLREE
jgi:hypothetical protein